MKIIFTRNHKPYLIGDTIEGDSSADVKTMNWFKTIGAAKEDCDCEEHSDKEGCEGCGDKKKAISSASAFNVKTSSEPVVIAEVAKKDSVKKVTKKKKANK